MTPREYIESGAIEAYIMGLADEKDVQLQEAMERMYPEVKAARERMELDMEAAALQEARPASTEAGERILKALQSEMRQHESAHAQSNGTTQQPSVAPVLPLPKTVDTAAPKPIKWFRSALAAAVLLLMGSILINFYYFSKYADYRTRYKELLTQQNALLAKKYTLEGQLAVMKDPVMKQVRLDPAAAGIYSVATVYWNSNTSEVFLMVNKMPDPGAGKQYQLWAQVDGKMVDAGVLDLTQDSLLHKMKSFKNPQAFAITIEKEGGSPTPTLSMVQVIGKV